MFSESDYVFLKNFILSDLDFQTVFVEYKKTKNEFEKNVIDFLDYIFNEKIYIYLDKKYIDIQYVVNSQTNNIIDLDLLYNMFKCDLEDEEE